MKYSKEPLTIEQQADLLLQRGLQADKKNLVKILSSINYYRLSGYLYPYKDAETKAFKENTNLEDVMKVYDFDRRLRFLLFEGVKKVEIFFKTKVAYSFSHEYGCFAYTNGEHFPNMKEVEFAKFLESLKSESRRSKEVFVKHFFDKYGDSHQILPLWMAVELLSFGLISRFFSGLDNSLKVKISRDFEVNHRVLSSWMRSFCYVRNLCAHHSRLWNRQLAIKPKIPKKHNFLKIEGVRNDKLFFVFLLLKKIVNRIDFSSDWSDRMNGLFLEGSEFLPKMGFPCNWREYFE